MKDKRERDLYYYCEAIWTPDNKSQKSKLYLIEKICDSTHVQGTVMGEVIGEEKQ